MGLLTDRAVRALSVMAMAILLTLPQTGFSQSVEEDPSALAMFGDLVVARPFLFMITAVGTATYVVSLPFTLAGGNAEEAGETLVVGPAMNTFVRCLGCTRPGYQHDSPTEQD